MEPRLYRTQTVHVSSRLVAMSAGVPEIEQEIYTSIAADFGGAPEAVDVAARRHMQTGASPEQLQVEGQPL